MPISIRRLWALAAMVVAASCLATPALARENEAVFTRQMAERFRAALPGRTVEITAPLELRINSEPDPSNIYVGRIFDYCGHATAEECEASMAHFVQGHADGIETLGDPITRDQLRVVVRPSEYCDEINGASGPNPEGLIMRPYLPGLCMLVMADFPNRRHGINPEHLGEIGLAADEAWRVAERQTLANLPRPDALEGLEQDIVVVTDDYASSLLLHSEGWLAARGRYGDMLVAIPASDEMIVGRAATIDDLESLRAVVQREFETAERPVSPTIYRFGPTGWTRLD